MGEIVKYEPTESLTLQKVSEGLFASGLFPNTKNKFGAFAIVQYGRELGIPPMMALRNINIISGQLACSAQLMLSLAIQKGVSIDVLEEGDRGAKLKFKRGSQEYVSAFTEADAKAANLLGKDNWRKYPRDMYYWRAVAKGVRRICPDAVMGLYTAEEITEGAVINVAEVNPSSPEPPVSATVENATFTETAPRDTPRDEPDDIPVEFREEPQEDIPVISEAQRKRLFAISKKAGWPNDDLKQYLQERYGISHTSEIPKAKYEEICTWVESHTGWGG